MYYRVINIIKLHSLLKNKIIKIKLNKNDFKIINIFIKLNIIKYIKKYKRDTYHVYLNNDIIYNGIINLNKSSKPTTITLNNLIKINKKKNNIFYLSTNMGVINNFEAEKQKVGGFLIMNM
jgi:ribosomal protein S8